MIQHSVSVIIVLEWLVVFVVSPKVEPLPLLIYGLDLPAELELLAEPAARGIHTRRGRDSQEAQEGRVVEG